MPFLKLILAYTVAGFILATLLALLLCVPKKSCGRSAVRLGRALAVEVVCAVVLLFCGMLQFNPAVVKEEVEKPLQDQVAKLQQQGRQSASAAQDVEARAEALQQQIQADQQALARAENERRQLLQQIQNQGKEITTTEAESVQGQMQQLQEQLKAAQAEIAQLKEVNGALNDELATHAVHPGRVGIVPTPQPGMTPLIR